MAPKRTDRLNSLLREVISEVVSREVKDPHVHRLATITRVEITKDLHYAKVYVSVLGTQDERLRTVEALQIASGFIAVTASKKITIRYFPALTFKLDNTVDSQMRIGELLSKIEDERRSRPTPPSSEE